METKTKNNPLFSARNLSFVILAVAIGVSGYLSYLKVDTNARPACSVGDVFDCGTVLNSVYSEIMGVPIAWLGLGVNLLVVALLVLEPRVPFFSEYSVPLIFGVLLFAFLFSVYLVYVQAFLITRYCPWCLSHEALVAAVFALSTKRLMDWMDRDESQIEQVSD
ncbi:MAG: vitamin K epoxide reductase family protein [Anaerolineae bacterium]